MLEFGSSLPEWADLHLICYAPERWYGRHMNVDARGNSFHDVLSALAREVRRQYSFPYHYTSGGTWMIYERLNVDSGEWWICDGVHTITTRDQNAGRRDISNLHFPPYTEFEFEVLDKHIRYQP